jgi:hypothetical protein
MISRAWKTEFAGVGMGKTEILTFWTEIRWESLTRGRMSP